MQAYKKNKGKGINYNTLGLEIELLLSVKYRAPEPI